MLPSAGGSAHHLAYSLYQLRYCGRHFGGELGAEAEVAAGYLEDREPCRQAPEHPGQLHGVAEADAVRAGRAVRHAGQRRSSSMLA
jgi:hypothetical protein